MTLSHDRQLDFLRKVWGGTTDGYVFLPWLPGHLSTKAERKARGSWQEVCFKWPEQQEDILAHLNERTEDDLYFCPNIFEQPHRTSEALDINQRVLYADLDEVDPESIDHGYRPTIAWQTSDDRYQAVWLLSQNEIGLSEEGNENHCLTYYLGADKNGWDCTQLLRVPGRVNHKPGKKGQQGVMLWQNGPVYEASDFKDLPAVRVVSAHEDIDDAILDSIDRKAVWRGVRMKVSTRCRDYMSIRNAEVAQDASESFPEGMSGLLWYVERELADAGLSVAEIVALVRPMAWNKFAGRSDELTRLKTEASKAVAVTAEESGIDAGDEGALETVDELGTDLAIDLHTFLAMPRKKPSWLVDKIWPDGAVGFIAGSPKSYKSWAGLDLALSVATGTPFLGVYKVRQNMVIYIQEEDGDTEVEDRVHKVFAGKPPEIHPWGWMEYIAGGDGPEKGPAASRLVWHPYESELFMRVMVRKGLDLTDDVWQGLLAEMCEEYEPGLIVIDTLGTSAGDIDIDKSREVNKALKPLKVLSGEYGSAVAIVHHFNKMGGSGGGGGNGGSGGNGSGGRGGGGGVRGGAKMLGSVALHAWVENALYVSDKQEIRDGVWGVRIDRECKRAMDLSFNLEIPEISRGRGWAPVIIKPEAHPVSENGDSNGVQKANGAPPKWVHLTRKMLAGGVRTKERARTVQQIREIFEPGMTRQGILAQLVSAIDQGCVKKDDSALAHLFWVDKETLENKYARK